LTLSTHVKRKIVKLSDQAAFFEEPNMMRCIRFEYQTDALWIRQVYTENWCESVQFFK